MISELHLKGASLLVYAYLSSFDTYSGTQKKIVEYTGLTRMTVYYTIQNLYKKGLISVDEEGNIQCIKIIHNVKKLDTSIASEENSECIKIIPERIKNIPECIKIIPPYIIHNNTDNTTAAAAINSNIRVSNKERKSVFGVYKNVHLTDKQYSLLKDQYGEDISEAIDILSKHKYSRGREYAEDYAPLADWVADRLNKEKARRTQPAAIPQEPIIDKRNQL